MKLMLKLLFMIVVAAIAEVCRAETPVAIEVFADKEIGTIRQSLAGVSQGGNACSYLNDKVLDGLKDLPVKLVRIEMITCAAKYKLYNPESGQWDWTLLDKEIDNAQRSGAEVIINLFGTPVWMSSEPQSKMPFFAPPKDFNGYAEFCAKIAYHVNIEKGYKVKYWEFWNEPSGNYFWSAWKKDKKRFFDLYAVTAKAVKQVDPQIMFGGFGDNVFYQEHYVDFFSYAKANNVPIDFLTIHWYGDWDKQGALHPEWYDRFATKLSMTYQNFFGKKVPIFYSEWNLPAESVKLYSAAQIGAYISSSLYWMQQNPEIHGAAFFRIQHYRDPYSSLFDSAYGKKVPWRILKMFMLLPEKQLKAVGGNSNLYVLAARDAKRLAVMLTRYQPGEKILPIIEKIIIDGLSAGSVYNMSIYKEEGNMAEKVREFMPEEKRQVRVDGNGVLTLSIDLPQYSTILIELDK